MQKKQPGPRVTLLIGEMTFSFILIVALSLILWEAQDFAASFAAREMSTQTTLRTTEERDDGRIVRAFESAKKSIPCPATLVTETNPQQQTRDSLLTVTAKTKSETLANREALVQAIQSAFALEGPGKLFDVGNAPFAKPVPNETMGRIKGVFRGLSIAVLLAGLVLVVLRWKKSHLPKLALVGTLATGLTFFLQGEHDAAIALPILISILPIALLSLFIYLTLKVKKAAGWQEGRARITESKAVSERHRFQGDTTRVTNQASVTYDFKVGSQIFHGNRISIGIAPADKVDQVLKRYPVGAEVPVFYDTDNPKDCVLERDPPVSLGCLWTGAFILLSVYGIGVAVFYFGVSLDALFKSAFPQVHHPLAVTILGFLGLFSLAAGLWMRLHPRKVAPWLRTQGSIVSSATECTLESISSSNSSQRRYYKAVIEFSYTVEGQTYHNTVGASDVITVSVSGNQASADAEVKRHPPGMAVDVFCDPQDPTRSALKNRPEMTLDGTRSLIVSAVLLALAFYAAHH